MRVVVAGSSGFIGSELVRQLRAAGDEVVRLVRRPPESADEVAWDPAGRMLDPAALRGVDAVVNLAGESLNRLPWTRRRKRAILDSRIAATETLVTALRTLADVGGVPSVLVNGSAVGYYGSRPGVTLDEAAPRGSGFLAEVVGAWEGATRAAPLGTRVVLARTGIVLGSGGALGPVFALTRAGLGGPLGSGR